MAVRAVCKLFPATSQHKKLASPFPGGAYVEKHESEPCLVDGFEPESERVGAKATLAGQRNIHGYGERRQSRNFS
jgi:hypothetical protein